MPIFDQGYQHWSGRLAGHAWRWLAITRHGLRIGMSGRILRLVVLASWMPAGLLAFFLCLWGLLERNSSVIAPFLWIFQTFFNPTVLASPKLYRAEVWTVCYSYFLHAELWFSMIVILLVGPNLISRDLRYNALPLYFSRPIRRIDYFFGKLGVIVAFLGMVVIVPSVVAYVLGLLFTLDRTIIGDTFGILLSAIGYGLVIAVSAGTFVLALSSLSRNSRYIALLWLGVWFVSDLAWVALEGVHGEQRRHSRSLGNSENSAAEYLRESREAARSNWRPLVSYFRNLDRVGEHLLGTNAAWEKLTAMLPPFQREQFLRATLGPQFPWYWSAGVLAGLFGLSLCILRFSIKSLDRLK